ncbi:hypothetical protein ACFQ3Y_24790 [Paenibacillus motobuensis]|uniref:hypothetical protein n=1 Tax=Paenibacillus motobuensis TaxID=295324 RepID=UPI003640A93A
MVLFPATKRSNQEVAIKLDTLVSENAVLKSVIVRSEAQISALTEQVTGLRSEVGSLVSIVQGMVDGSSSFNFPAHEGSAVKGYRVYPEYGTPADIESLGPEDRAREVKRKKIADRIYEYATSRGLSTSDDSIGVYYRQFYDKLEKATGYRPRKAKAFKYIGPLGRKVFTLIDEGYADIYIALIQQEIDAATHITKSDPVPPKKRRGRPKKNAA